METGGDKPGQAARAGVGARKGGRGNPSFAGYEYQIDATVWLALELMLARSVSEELVVEPPSQEDVEAAVRDKAAASLGMASEEGSRRFSFQIKSRSGEPWSAAALGGILTRGRQGGVSPKPARESPLEMLETDDRGRFVLITNETTSEALRRFEVEDVLEASEARSLPRGARQGRAAGLQASLAGRIAVHGRVTKEVLGWRTRGLLSSHGHVVAVRHDACVAELREEVRQRMAGAKSPEWSRDDLVERLVSHGGSVSPRRNLDLYVAPGCLGRIEDALSRFNAVVIAGPSGTGKTLTAEVLEERISQGNPPFDVVTEERGPGHVERQTMRDDAVLFHLRDPWGKNRLGPDADGWSAELSRLLPRAGPGKKFVVTSRSDILQLAGPAVAKELGPYTVAIEIEDYGPDRLRRIYDGIAGDLATGARAVARGCRDTALGALTRPYEIERFLLALSRESVGAARRLDDIVAESQIDAIASVVARQVTEWSEDGAASAAIIWALMTTRGTTTRREVRQLQRSMRTIDRTVRPDAEAMLEFLIAGSNVREQRTVLSYHHPRVEEGLRVAFTRQRNEAEHALSLAVAALVELDSKEGDLGVEAAVGVMRATVELEDVEIEISLDAQGRIDAFLEKCAVETELGFDFRRGLRELARFGGPSHVPSRLARMLVEPSGVPGEVRLEGVWSRPVLEPVEVGELAGHPLTPCLVARFVREVLADSATHYGDGLADVLRQLVPGIESAFWDALEGVADGTRTCGNLDAIVGGACAGEAADFERAITIIGRSDERVRAWLDQSFEPDRMEAEEQEVDAALVDGMLDEPQERLFNGDTAMEAVVRRRGSWEGLAWIAGHRYRDCLVRAAARSIRSGELPIRPGELRMLFDAADDWERGTIWAAGAQHWHAANQLWEDDLGRVLERELNRGGQRQGYRRSLINATRRRAGEGADWVEYLVKVVGAVPVGRKLELVFDVVASGADIGAEGVEARVPAAERLAETMPVEVGELARLLAGLLAGTETIGAAGRLSEDARAWLSRNLAHVPADVAGVLIVVGASIDIDPVPTARRLLEDGDADDGLVAVQALVDGGGESAVPILRHVLDHAKYCVREAALKAVVSIGRASDREHVLRKASDRSAAVRLAFAEAMGRSRWPEAVGPLAELLRDRRDFSTDYSGRWSKFGVARAAAQALGSYVDLPESAVGALVDAAREESPDPFVGCFAIRAVATRESDGIAELIAELLDSAGLAETPQVRPKAQAAAQAVYFRVVAEQPIRIDEATTRMATEDRAAIAGPLLMAAGISGGQARAAVLDRLEQNGSSGRVELVRVAAAAACTTAGLRLSPTEVLLARVAEDQGTQGLSEGERGELEEWSLGLDPTKDVEKCTAWIAHGVFGLPISEDAESPWVLEAPGGIPMVTMRSFGPLREREVPGP